MWNGTLGRLLVMLVACLGLNAALTLQNVWPTLWVEPGRGVSVELLAVLAIVAVLLEWRPRLGGGWAWSVAAVLFLLMLGRYFAVTAHALFGRSINLYFDLPYLPAVAAMAAESQPILEMIFFAVLLVVLPAALLLAIRYGVGAVAWSLSDRPLRRVVLGAAAAGVGIYSVAGPLGIRWAERAFALPVSPVYAEQVKFVADALGGREDRTFLSRSASLPPLNPKPLAGGDVFVFFLESYGEVAYSVPEIAEAVRPRIAAAEKALRDKGWHMASAFFTSPTFGGGSWLAHSSFLTGIPVSRNRDYQLLLSSGRASLVAEFSKAGYRTIALMPGLKLAWPEGAFYGFDRIYDAAGLDYEGKPFGWWTIPDQFTVARMLGKETRTVGRKPLFVVFPTVMSHMPFAPVPPYLSDWARAADPAAYGEAAARPNGMLGDWKAARGAYRTAMLYDIDMLEGFLTKRAPAKALVLALGDHQPPGVVSGPGADWLVPVHIFSRDKSRIIPFEAAGFRDGLTPKGATLGDFEALHRKFAAGLR